MESLQSERIVEDIVRAYQLATGKWTGWDWPTQFGMSRLNLNGLKASQALLLARATSGIERADWHAAVPWLTRIEQDAKEAEAEAERAVSLSRSGRLQEALTHAKRACAIEENYHNKRLWQPLHDAIEGVLSVAAS